jgi:hypothetical protein
MVAPVISFLQYLGMSLEQKLELQYLHTVTSQHYHLHIPHISANYQAVYKFFTIKSHETKQSGSKLLPHSDLRGGVFLGEISSSRSHYSKKDYKGKKPIYIYKIYDITVRACDELYANKLIFTRFS